MLGVELCAVYDKRLCLIRFGMEDWDRHLTGELGCISGLGKWEKWLTCFCTWTICCGLYNYLLPPLNMSASP